MHNWAQAVASAELAGAGAVVVFNDLDAMESGWRAESGEWSFECVCVCLFFFSFFVVFKGFLGFY